LILTNLGMQARKFAIDNSPSILTTIGIVGTVTTAVLTGKATYSAVVSEFMDGYETSEWQNARDLTPRDRVKRHWKLYIPAVGSGVFTITAIVGANRIGTRRAAGIAAAFTLSEKAYSEYRDKVVEKLGENKERALRDELAQDRVTRTPGGQEVIISGTDVLCFDAYSGRYFRSSMEAMKKAQNDLNVEVINVGYASLTDLYNLLGLAKTSASDEVGWTTDDLLDMKFSTTLAENGQPCLAIDFQADGVRDYWRNR
jgi:hypothetical protein